MFNYIVAVALFVAPAIAVPWTNATCVDQFWSYNSRVQSPCLVAAYLGAQCTTDNTFGIYSLQGTAGGPYGFTAEAASNCVWGQWVASCPSSMINIGKYPIPLPAGVAVPSWAYYDFTVTGYLNTVTASQVSGIESTAVSGATATSAPDPLPTSTTEANGGVSTSKPVTTQSQSNSNNMGAIIGGVVGGVLGIALVCLIAFVLVRKGKTEDPTTKYPEAGKKPLKSPQTNLETPMTAQVPPYQFSVPNQPTPTPEYKPYDPSDPATFPTAPVAPATGFPAEPYAYHPQGAPGLPNFIVPLLDPDPDHIHLLSRFRTYRLICHGNYIMFFDCNASFVAYALLSTFTTITEKERDAVRFIIELIPCYDEATGKLRMTFDAHVLAQIYLAELRVMAGRHSYTHDGSLEEAAQARALLNVVIMPLIRHLCPEEYNDLLDTLEEAYFLLSRPLDALDELVIMWRIRNATVARDWRSHPIGHLDNYKFGIELPTKFSLEDLLTPLPYPTKSPSSIVTEYVPMEPGVDLAEYQAQLIDSNKTRSLPRSECAKELELKEKPKTNSNVFAIPFLGRSRGSLGSRSEYSYSSSGSEASWSLTEEELKRTSDPEMNRPMGPLNRKSDRNAETKPPRRKWFSRCVKALLKHA
ncbi:unnamed protein product [Rhizoctonia solani]|uniref:Uncharacterized protein n=1 Tax=Rhizoctonia solani TaxID=456999 RepID=A0A8H3GWJ0_9AGAM|nr:unnamed protein product [Rhizoctonia solani]